MKQTTVLIYLVTIVTMIQAYARQHAPYQYPKTGQELQLDTALNWSINNYNTQNVLKEVKYFIISGNLEQAKLLLNKADFNINFTAQIKRRYLAIINFIEGNYETVIKILSHPDMLAFNHLAKYCFLKTLSLVILEKSNLAKKEWKHCKEASRPYSKNNLTWMQTIIDLKMTEDKEYLTKFFNKIKIENYEGQYLRIYLKLALYLNQQDKIIPKFKLFGKSPLEDLTERELIGLNYYRNGNILKAYQLLEGLDTANAEVFKGNIYLHQKKYEPAYAQFKLALKRKSNSQNALERLLPLSWKLNQYGEGIDFLNKMVISNRETLEHDTLLAVFSSMAEKYEMSNYYLKRIDLLTNKNDPVEVSQVRVLTHLKRKNYIEILTPAIDSCSGNDGINCWLIMALTSWEGLPEQLGKEDLIHQDLVNLTERYNSETPLEQFNDTQLLEQKTIEELDNDLISL